LSLEGRILLACARHGDGRPDPDRILKLLDAAVNWGQVARLVELHALGPLSFKGLFRLPPGRIPQWFLAQLRDRCSARAARSLLLVMQLHEVLDCLAGAGIVAVPYKGPVLAQMLYGDVAMRESMDLDLLVRKRDVPFAHDALGELGYEPQLKLDCARQQALRRFDYEAPMVRGSDQSLLDLQWASPPRFLSLPAGPDFAGARFATVTLGGREVRTLCAEDLLLVLCSHGAKHVWGRLQWIADVAGVVEVTPFLNWDELLERATAWRRRRMLLLGLSLAHDLLDAPLPEGVLTAIQAEPEVGHLARAVRERLFSVDAGETSVGEQTRFLAAAMDCRFDTARYLARLAVTPTPGDWEAVTLPGWLMAGYYLVRPLRLLGKYVLSRKRR
jgi:hypothetical protein